MTKFMINNRTDAWKSDVNLLNFADFFSHIQYKLTVKLKEAWQYKDGNGWRRMTRITNDEFDKFRLNFLTWANRYVGLLSLFMSVY